MCDITYVPISLGSMGTSAEDTSLLLLLYMLKLSLLDTTSDIHNKGYMYTVNHVYQDTVSNTEITNAGLYQ